MHSTIEARGKKGTRPAQYMSYARFWKIEKVEHTKSFKVLGGVENEALTQLQELEHVVEARGPTFHVNVIDDLPKDGLASDCEVDQVTHAADANVARGCIDWLLRGEGGRLLGFVGRVAVLVVVDVGEIARPGEVVRLSWVFNVLRITASACRLICLLVELLDVEWDQIIVQHT